MRSYGEGRWMSRVRGERFWVEDGVRESEKSCRGMDARRPREGTVVVA